MWEDVSFFSGCADFGDDVKCGLSWLSRRIPCLELVSAGGPAMRILLALIVSAAFTPQASACCLFPFFPTYSAGYYGWGAPAYSAGYGPGYYSAGYAPMQYGYGGGMMYSASYAGFSSNTSCCPSPCVQDACCGSSCGGCSSCTSGNCTPTEVRKEPVPDPLSNERDSSDKRPGREGYDSTVPDPLDTFSRPNRGTDGLTDPDLGGGGSQWTPPGTGGRRTEPGGTFGGGSDPLDDRTFRGGSGTEAPFFNQDPDPSSGTPGGTINRGANKPPMNLPIDEAAEPETPVLEQSSEEDAGTEVRPEDFLAPETGNTTASRLRPLLSDLQARSSHSDVLSMQRLAGRSNSSRTQATQISSSKPQQKPAQWISVPLPAGRVRL